MKDEHYMRLALNAAKKAGQRDEVPIGAVIVQKSGLILSGAYNLCISTCDPLAHAEVLAIRKAAKKVNNYRLPESTLYVTIEPCLMCMGAIVHARITRLVYGAKDIKWGAAGSLYDFSCDLRLNHRPEVKSGVLEEECRKLIQDFFQLKRTLKKSKST